jgi:hypothetical protein
VCWVEPAGGFEHLTALVRHMQAPDRLVLDGIAVGGQAILVEDRPSPCGGFVPATVRNDLPHRDRHEPGPEALRGT